MGYRPGTRRRLPLRGLPGSPVSSWLNFDPRQIANVAFWFDGADTTTITASGSPLRVSQWDDKSGNGLNVVQATGTNQPVSGATLINGLNVIDFTGARRLALQNVSSAQNVDGFTLFAVVRGTYVYSGLVTFCRLTTNNATQTARSFVGCGASGLTPVLRSGGRRLDGDSFVSQTISAVNNRVYTAVGINDYANATSTVRRAGDRAILSPFQTAGSTSNTTSRIVIGNDDDGLNPFQGSVGEVIGFSRTLTTNELIAVETYLNNKWRPFIGNRVF